MPVQPGTRLAPYEVLAPVNTEGMREIFRGRDSKLANGLADP
jgi:hypothetical protein